LQSVADRVVDAYLFASTEVGLEWVDRRIIKQSGKIAAIMQSSSRFQPIDKHAARVKLGIGGSPLFLWVGRLDPNKDPLTVIRAFNRFAATRPDARLYMIYTDAPLLPNVRDAIAQAPSPALIALVGTVKNKELETWYSAADFILSGSHSEGSGIAVIEAMSCGCIPIVTTIPSFRAMTADGTVGFLYPPGDAGALLDRLHHATTTDLPALGQRVRKRFERELSFPALAHKIRTLAADLGRFQGTEQG
ncbi:MAG: hypothetical protein JWP27_353, partial [Flaviaesturariibacter sp.]|nr:hypothetical protein [Flaviaesturariibacter sp.]